MQDGQSSQPSWPKWLPLAGLVILALLARLPRIGEIVSTHDWLTSHTALVTRVWQMTGLKANHYSLVTNWPNPSDRQVEHGVASVFDEQGNTYFLSFPPLAFYLSYLFFQMVGEGASIFPLRLLTMLASSFGAWALARAIRSAWGDGAESRMPGLIAAGVFLLSPVSLLYFGAAYFSLILSIPMWMGLVAAAMQPKPRLWLIGLASFTICYTDWLGYLAAVPLAIVWLRRREWRLVAALCVPAGLALTVTLATYASIAGWLPMIQSAQTKYLMRAGLSGASNLSAFELLTYLRIWRHYYQGFAPLAIPFLWCGVCFALGRGRPGKPLPAAAWTLLFCLAVPVALDHVLLINHTANDRYTVLKTAPVLGVALAMCMRARPWKSRRLDAACMLATMGVSFALYYRMTFDADPIAPEIARVVQYQAGFDRVLFLQRNNLLKMAEPSFLLLSERNFHMVDSIGHARAELRRLGLAKGYYVKVLSYRPPRADGMLIEP